MAGGHWPAAEARFVRPHALGKRGYGVELRKVPAYSVADWERDRQEEASGDRLACPNCGRSEWYHPVGIPPETGEKRKYRACKVCGFWQEADGSSAYRCLMTAHVCLGDIKEGAACPYCGTWGPREWHAGCWRILRQPELGVTKCNNCGVALTEDHVVPWPVVAH